MQRTFVRVVLIASLAFCITSCAWIRQIVDRISPPVTSVHQQYASVESNLAQAKDFEADLGAFIDATTLSEVVAVEIKKAAINRSGEDLQIDTLTPNVRLVDQGIGLDVAFDGLVKAHNVRVQGQLKGMVAVSTSGDRVLLRPTLDMMKLSKLRLESRGPVNVDLSKLVNTLVEKFIANLNGAFATKPIVVDLNWSYITKVDLVALNQNPALSIQAQRRTIGRHFAGSLLRIDDKGLAMLIALTDVPANVNEENEFPSPQPDKPVTAAQFNAHFRTYSDTFRQKWEDRLDGLAGNSPVEVYVAKAEIASLLNAVTDQAITLGYTFNVPMTRFNEVVEAKKSKVDCQKVYEPFRRLRYQRASCDWNCQRCVLGICTDEPLCRASRAACNIREEAKVLEDNLEWEAERIQHNLDQEARVGACNVWRETTSILAVGRFTGDMKGNGEMTAGVDGIHFDPLLGHVDLKDFNVNVNGKAAIDMKATPHDLGHVFFCVAPSSVGWIGSYKAQVRSATQRIKVDTFQDGADLVLQVQLPEVSYKASVSPSPLEALMTEKDFLVKCSVGAHVLLAALPTAEVAGVLGLKQGSMIFDAALGRFSGVQKLGTLEQRIKPVSVDVDGRAPIIVAAAMGTKSIQLRASNAQ